MNIIARHTLEAFWSRHRETEGPLKAWFQIARRAEWQSMDDIVSTFSKASPINAERCVFDICGGNYRLIVAFKFRSSVAFIKFVGTHKDYDRINAATVDQY